MGCLGGEGGVGKGGTGVGEGGTGVGEVGVGGGVGCFIGGRGFGSCEESKYLKSVSLK